MSNIILIYFRCFWSYLRLYLIDIENVNCANIKAIYIKNTYIKSIFIGNTYIKNIYMKFTLYCGDYIKIIYMRNGYINNINLIKCPKIYLQLSQILKIRLFSIN